MTKIKFRYEWYDDAKTVMRLIAEEDWNWKDYHAAVRVAAFAISQQPHPVHTVIDFRQQTRPNLPAGSAAHMSSFGKKVVPAISGYVIVLGVSAAERAALPLNSDGTLSTKDGSVYFADSDEQARILLKQFPHSSAT